MLIGSWAVCVYTGRLTPFSSACGSVSVSFCTCGSPPHLSWIRRTSNPTPTPLLPADESMSAEICVTSRLSHCHTAPNHKLMTGSQHPTHPQWVDLFLNRLSFFHDRVWSTAWLNHAPHLTQNHDVYLIKNWLRWGSAWPENNSSFFFWSNLQTHTVAYFTHYHSAYSHQLLKGFSSIFRLMQSPSVTQVVFPWCLCDSVLGPRFIFFMIIRCLTLQLSPGYHGNPIKVPFSQTVNHLARITMVLFCSVCPQFVAIVRV